MPGNPHTQDNVLAVLRSATWDQSLGWATTSQIAKRVPGRSIAAVRVALRRLRTKDLVERRNVTRYGAEAAWRAA